MQKTLDYTLKHHSRAKHIRIKINALGSVEVTAPPHVSAMEVQNFVLSNIGWIDSTRTKMKDHRLSDPDYSTEPPTRINLVAIGKLFNIKYEIQSRANLFQDNNNLHIHAADDHQRIEILKFWLQQMAKQFLVPWLHNKARENQLVFNKIIVRAQKSRWGSCSAKKNININQNLLFLPEELVNYLFAHELSHLVHLNHSSDFWRHVQKMEPDFRQLDKALNNAHRDIPLWALHP